MLIIGKRFFLHTDMTKEKSNEGKNILQLALILIFSINEHLSHEMLLINWFRQIDNIRL